MRILTAPHARLNDHHWFRLIVAIWIGVISWGYREDFTPVQHWFEVRSVQVVRVDGGQCSQIEMWADRAIHRPFHGEWTVTLMRRMSSGAFTTFEVYTGRSDYRPGNALPDRIDLCWWTWPAMPELPPGVYRINARWDITTGRGAHKVVLAETEVFEVTE